LTTRGALVLTGNGKQMILAKPDILLNGFTGSYVIGFTAKNVTRSVVDLGHVSIPRSIAGNTFSLGGLASTVAGGNYDVFRGDAPQPGDPGDGAAPNYPTDRTVSFGTVSMKLKLKLQR
jgi:hypothetical protein